MTGLPHPSARDGDERGRWSHGPHQSMMEQIFISASCFPQTSAQPSPDSALDTTEEKILASIDPSIHPPIAYRIVSLPLSPNTHDPQQRRPRARAPADWSGRRLGGAAPLTLSPHTSTGHGAPPPPPSPPPEIRMGPGWVRVGWQAGKLA
ncbi:hypothetical protein Purlil1_8908 [Purpureocillium lilacinum]|uniref:Uncharacterized protein n=1 Tax=Purpureocillium lilacinum TaxID=33203 RepID=A0ABR0BRR3_PURLI|nr:hypothetical protein Purlil1_8908 [Purpureocillium lilacinum]